MWSYQLRETLKVSADDYSWKKSWVVWRGAVAVYSFTGHAAERIAKGQLPADLRPYNRETRRFRQRALQNQGLVRGQRLYTVERMPP